jgi:hypothetical protein
MALAMVAFTPHPNENFKLYLNNINVYKGMDMHTLK